MNYIAITGARCTPLARAEKPVPPLNLVGGFGSGALYLAFGLLAGVIEPAETGKGQVIDCAMSDGAASLMAMFYGFKASGMWQETRRSNLLDGGAHFYDTYQCADGKWISIGSIEPQFYALLLEKTGISDPEFARQMDRSARPVLREKLASVPSPARPRPNGARSWTAPTSASPPSSTSTKHQASAQCRPIDLRGGGWRDPAGARRAFSVTPGAIRGPPPAIGAHDREALLDWASRLQGRGAGQGGALPDHARQDSVT